MLVAYIPLKKPCHVYWIFLDLFNRCTQNINFILGKIGKSSVLKGLTWDDRKFNFYGNDFFELKTAITSYLNLFQTVLDKPGHVLSLSGLLYPLRVHINITSSSDAWLIIIIDENCQYCLKWYELTRNGLCDPTELNGSTWPN